ncbi:MAG: dihydrolipoyl dehydrogenase [Gemmataceae bacterium]|nr:dihydrolipoyl dehydrogenase [Gemmataceae bacterium]
MPDRYDVVIIGSGPGGYVAALRAAQLGMKVACVEKSKTLGGTCLNIGCIPSKALLDSSELYRLAKTRFSHHGIGVKDVELDLARMIARKSEVVKSLTDGIAFLFRKNKITWLQGTGKVLGKSRVQVTGDKTFEVEAGSIILAAGSEPAPLPFLQYDGTHVVSSTEALSFAQVPEHLIVIGGGYIGLEMGSVWSRLGSKVTVLEFLPNLLPMNDRELAGILHKSLVKQGLDIRTNTKVTGATKDGGRITVTAEEGGKKVDFKGDKVLLSVGRRPAVAALGLKEAGIAFDEKSGKVPVNEHYQTNVAGIYAIGDMIAGPMLAHKASEEGLAVAEHLSGRGGHVNYATIPSVIYTHPELASVGITEEQAKESGVPYRVGKFPFMPNGRAKAMDETEGLVKTIADAKTDRILGVHILGPRASDLIGELVMAMEFGATAEDVARTCHAHPSLSETVGESARAAWTTALHV